LLLRVKDEQARTWYANEAVTQGWSVRALDRQIGTLFYERLLGSQDKAGVQAEAVALMARDTPADPLGNGPSYSRCLCLCAGNANAGLAARLLWNTPEQFGVKLELAAPAWRLFQSGRPFHFHGALVGLPA
jgi:hypothetical protein